MRAVHQLLITELTKLAADENSLSGAELDRLLAHFLLITSCGSDTLEQFQHVEYERFQHESNSEATSGLAVGDGSRSTLLTDFVSMLMTKIPDSIIEDLGMKKNEYLAALKVIWSILLCFEYSSFDKHHAQQLSGEQIERYLSGGLKSLKSFREVGEP